MTLLEDALDLNDQPRFDQVFGGIGQTEVGEYVARAGLYFKSFSFRHSSPEPTLSSTMSEAPKRASEANQSKSRNSSGVRLESCRIFAINRSSLTNGPG